MRDLETLSGPRVRRKGDDPARYHTQALVMSELLGLREEQLHADADAQKGLPRSYELEQRLDQLLVPQLLHAVAKRAVAGQYQMAGLGDLLGLVGPLSPGAQPLERPRHASEVAEVVHYRHARHEARSSGSGASRTGSPEERR